MRYFLYLRQVIKNNPLNAVTQATAHTIKMEQNNAKSLSERAMYYGTIFGGVMILTNIAYIIGLRVEAFSTVFLLLTAASPFIAGRLAATYRKRERNNSMGFVQAWLFLVIMYICAAMLTAIAQYIYFALIDNGFFMQFIQEQFSLVLEAEGLDDAVKDEIRTTANLLAAMSTRDIILQIFSTNIIISPIITFIIAIFVRKKQ